jgi:hypothetical protein
MFIFIDIDHTLANSFWRDSMVGTVPWDDYHYASKFDKPFKEMINLINILSMNGYTIIGLTGRTEKHRQLTLDWLLKNDVILDGLLMRPDDLFLKNADMKVQLVKEYLKNQLNLIAFIIDDNEDTILAFNALGISTLQIRNISTEIKDE